MAASKGAGQEHPGTLGDDELEALDQLMAFLRSADPWFESAAPDAPQSWKRAGEGEASVVAVCGNWYDLPHKAEVLAAAAAAQPDADVLLCGGRAERLTPAAAVDVGGEPILLQRALWERHNLHPRRVAVYTGSRVTNHNLRAMIHYAKQVHEFTGSAVRLHLVEEGFLVRRAAAALAKELKDPDASRVIAHVSFVPVGARSFEELRGLHRGNARVALALVLGEWERLRQYASPGAQTTAVHGSVQRGAVVEAGALDSLDPAVAAAIAELRAGRSELVGAGRSLLERSPLDCAPVHAVPREVDLEKRSRLELALLVASSGAFAWCSSWEGALSEMRVLLTGLLAAFSRNHGALAALPKAAPDTARDWPVFLMFTLGFYICNWGFRLLFVEPLVRYLGISKGHVSSKFAQSTMEALTYGSFAVVGLHVVPLQDFVWPSSQWWEGFAKGGHEIMRSDMRCYYIMYIARYCQALVSVLIEPKMKDFLQMLIHHSVTVTVIYISYIYGWNRVGVVVMALLDPADVPLHLAKLCKYIAEARGQLWQTVADRLFELFALIFFFTRLVCYGYVCWSAHIEATRYFDKGLPEWTCVALLEVLFALQLYWFSLIVKVAVRMIGGQGADDVRDRKLDTHAHHD